MQITSLFFTSIVFLSWFFFPPLVNNFWCMSLLTALKHQINRVVFVCFLWFWSPSVYYKTSTRRYTIIFHAPLFSIVSNIFNKKIKEVTKVICHVWKIVLETRNLDSGFIYNFANPSDCWYSRRLLYHYWMSLLVSLFQALLSWIFLKLLLLFSELSNYSSIRMIVYSFVRFSFFIFYSVGFFWSAFTVSSIDTIEANHEALLPT